MTLKCYSDEGKTYSDGGYFVTHPITLGFPVLALKPHEGWAIPVTDRIQHRLLANAIGR